MSDSLPKPSRIPWPPLIYAAALIAGIVLALFYPLPWITGLLADILVATGWVLLLGVVALWITGVRTMIRARTTLNPTAAPDHLVTDGPFAISRNPLYLANTMLLIGVGLIAGSLWYIAAAFIAGFATQKLAIEGEEKLLAAKFGKRYRDYARSVRRWI